MPEPLADVVPLCRAVRHDDMPGVHCPHCASPIGDDGWAAVLPFGPRTGSRQTRHASTDAMPSGRRSHPRP